MPTIRAYTLHDAVVKIIGTDRPFTIDIDEKDAYKTGGIVAIFDCPKDQFLYELKGGNTLLRGILEDYRNGVNRD